MTWCQAPGESDHKRWGMKAGLRCWWFGSGSTGGNCPHSVPPSSMVENRVNANGTLSWTLHGFRVDD